MGHNGGTADALELGLSIQGKRMAKDYAIGLSAHGVWPLNDAVLLKPELLTPMQGKEKKLH